MDKDVWESWTQLEETKAFFAWLQFAREETKEAWARGGYTAETAEKAAIANAAAIGGLRVIDSILNKDFIDE